MRIAMLSFSLGALGALPGCPSPVTGVFAGGTLGFLLNQLLDQVNTVIGRAQAAGEALEIRAGSEVYLAVANARSAYADSLNLTMDRLDRSVTMKVQEIRTLVTNLESHTAADVQRIEQDAQQIVNSLPFASGQPQVTRFSPNFVVAGADQVHVRVLGNFTQAMRPNLQPYIELEGQRALATGVSTQALDFVIPRSAFGPSDGARLEYAALRLHVPYETGVICKSRQDGQFSLMTAILPSSPGRITFHGRTVTQGTESRAVVSPTFMQHSSNDDLTQQHCGPAALDGWTIQPATVRFVVEWSQGDENDQWSRRSISTSNPHVCYEVRTVYHRFGTSGKVNFHYEYTVTRPTQSEETRDEGVTLRWGDSRTFPYAPGFWRVEFDAFDGSHNEFVGASEDNRYLHLGVVGSNVTLSVPAAEQIRW
jgi:hypothetical protein